MKRKIVRTAVALSLFALTIGAGFTGAAAAQEGETSNCGEAQGVHNAIEAAVGLDFETGRDFGHAAVNHAKTIGPPGELVSTICKPSD